MLSVSIDSAGWTVVTPSPDTRMIYVSSSIGSDTNSGLSPSAPLATIAKAVTLLQNNEPDWILLLRGDTFDENVVLATSGLSAQRPMVLTYYGNPALPRPIIDGMASTALRTGYNNDFVDIIGISFTSSTANPASPNFNGTNSDGLSDSGTSDLLVEDCSFSYFVDDVLLETVSAEISNVTIRRCEILDSYCTDGHSEGLYSNGVKGLTLEENSFDHDGWNTSVPGAGPTYYNHDCYLAADNTGVVVQDNIFAEAAAYGLQDRPGGIVEDNVFLDDPIDMTFGLVNGADTTAGGVSGIVNGNVFLGGGDLVGQPFGQGIVIGNIAPGYPTVLSNNIFADGLLQAQAAISLTYGRDLINPQDAVGINDLDIENNIVYDWYRGVFIDSGMASGPTGLTALNDVTVSDNDFQDDTGPVIQTLDPLSPAEVRFLDNSYVSPSSTMLVGNKTLSLAQWAARDETGATQTGIAFSDPTVTLASYNASVGGGASDSDFIAAAIQQSEQNWQPQYTAQAVISYFQTGFEDPASPQNWAPPTPPIVSAVSFPPTVVARNVTLQFTATFLDSDSPIDPTSLASGNLTVTARGFSASAQLVSSSGGGDQMQATYSIAAPQGMFQAGRRYEFKVSINPGQVRDMNGFPVAAGPVGTFKLVVVPGPKPPTVQAANLIDHAQEIAVRFSEDVSASLNVSDLVLESDAGQTIDPSLMTVSWNADDRTATWSFPGEPGGALPAGRWHLQIPAATLVNVMGQPLDGNNNGTGGDDFVLHRVLVSRGEVTAK